MSRAGWQWLVATQTAKTRILLSCESHERDVLHLCTHASGRVSRVFGADMSRMYPVPWDAVDRAEGLGDHRKDQLALGPLSLGRHIGAVHRPSVQRCAAVGITRILCATTTHFFSLCHQVLAQAVQGLQVGEALDWCCRWIVGWQILSFEYVFHHHDWSHLVVHDPTNWLTLLCNANEYCIGAKTAGGQ